ncbi:MAG: HAD-IA family hydrolase [Verrucomicrobiota bacterium]|nr:HAD-IA family hydrolase [Verrucomicrobiota bacterium]
MNGTNDSVLVFDMDDVLVDVLESYRASIIATVAHYTGITISNDLVQRYKNAGGWNDDWQLSQRIIFDTNRRDVPFDDVVAVFQQLFLGSDGDGLILRERWLPAPGLLERLASRHRLAIFTGRPRDELEITLSRFASEISWASTITSGDVQNRKPAPDGLLTIMEKHPGCAMTYVGDNIDDARSARAAGVGFVGIASRASGELRRLFQQEGAAAMIENLNEIEGVL